MIAFGIVEILCGGGINNYIILGKRMHYPKSKKLLHSLIDVLISEHVHVNLVNKRQLEDGNGGVFYSTNKEISCAIKRPFKEWFPVFLHEYNHYIQYKERPPIWIKEEINNSYETFYNWLDYDIELKKSEINFHCSIIKGVEADCERRVVKMIKSHNLEIDIDQYVQEASAYVCTYNIIAETRKNPKKYSKDLVSLMSPKRIITKFNNEAQRKACYKAF